MSGDVGLRVAQGVGEETRVEEAVCEGEQLGGKRGNTRDSCGVSRSSLRSVEDEDLDGKDDEPKEKGHQQPRLGGRG